MFVPFFCSSPAFLQSSFSDVAFRCAGVAVLLAVVSLSVSAALQ